MGVTSSQTSFQDFHHGCGGGRATRSGVESCDGRVSASKDWTVLFKGRRGEVLFCPNAPGDRSSTRERSDGGWTEEGVRGRWFGGRLVVVGRGCGAWVESGDVGNMFRDDGSRLKTTRGVGSCRRRCVVVFLQFGFLCSSFLDRLGRDGRDECTKRILSLYGPSVPTRDGLGLLDSNPFGRLLVHRVEFLLRQLEVQDEDLHFFPKTSDLDEVETERTRSTGTSNEVGVSGGRRGTRETVNARSGGRLSGPDAGCAPEDTIGARVVSIALWSSRGRNDGQCRSGMSKSRQRRREVAHAHLLVPTVVACGRGECQWGYETRETKSGTRKRRLTVEHS